MPGTARPADPTTTSHGTPPTTSFAAPEACVHPRPISPSARTSTLTTVVARHSTALRLELALAIPIAMWRRRRRATWRDWLGILAVLAGVAGFLLVAAPAKGIGNSGALTWITSLVPVGATVAVLVALATRARGPRRAMPLGAVAGTAFGLLAVLTKATTYELGRDLAGALTSWQPYLLIAAGIAALVISQSAYQAGPVAYSCPS